MMFAFYSLKSDIIINFALNSLRCMISIFATYSLRLMIK